MKTEYPEVKCPTCGTRGRWLEQAFGPFCSERCRLVDLGKWFDEDNRISSPLTMERLEDADAGFVEQEGGEHS